MVNEEISLFDDERLEKNNRQYKLKATTENGHLIKSKDRVQHHGEVFTPKWMVKQMLAEPSIQSKLNDIHATFFEPSAGEGAFLKEILHQKLNYVDHISNKSNWKNNALWALMSIYAIELLRDNLNKARASMLDIFINHYQAFMQRRLGVNTDLYKSVKYVINRNIVQGNTLTYKNDDDKLIQFVEWIPNGNNKVEFQNFTFKSLFNNGDIDDVDANEGQLSLFDNIDNVRKPKNVVALTKVYKQE